MAIVFNPFIPLPLGREIWMLLDYVAVGFLIYATITVVGLSDQVDAQG